MISLFSPSETKASGGCTSFSDHQHALVGGFKIRNKLIQAYERLLAGSDEQKITLTGWKNLAKIAALPKKLSSAPVLPAFQRYTGVGYQYLNFKSLKQNQQDFLNNHTFIFSNLFGPLMGSDMIPETKLKQTKKLEGINIAKHYREQTSDELDTIIGNQPILDLRAGTYRTFYTPKTETLRCVFLKNGTSVNHWSKAYRGIVLRAFAQHQPVSIKEFLTIKINGLTLSKYENNIATYTIT